MSQILVVCARRYNGHELWTLLGILQKHSITFEVVSTDLIIRDELTLQPNTLERTLYNISEQQSLDFKGIIIVSGNMSDTEAYWEDKHLQKLLLTMALKNKLIAAICCSVPTLGPVVAGRKVSYFPLVRSRHRLSYYGAILKTVSLTVDDNIITAENQMLSEMWSEEICNYLKGFKALYTLKDSKFTPKGGERRMPVEVAEAMWAAGRDDVIARPNKCT